MIRQASILPAAAMLLALQTGARAEGFTIPPSGVLGAPISPLSGARMPVPEPQRRAAIPLRKSVAPRPAHKVARPAVKQTPAPLALAPQSAPMPVAAEPAPQPLQAATAQPMPVAPAPVYAAPAAAPQPVQRPSLASKMRGLFAGRAPTAQADASNTRGIVPNYLLPARRSSYEDRGFFKIGTPSQQQTVAPQTTTIYQTQPAYAAPNVAQAGALY